MSWQIPGSQEDPYIIGEPHCFWWNVDYPVDPCVTGGFCCPWYIQMSKKNTGVSGGSSCH